jgi:hypothetical protein
MKRHGHWWFLVLAVVGLGVCGLGVAPAGPGDPAPQPAPKPGEGAAFKLELPEVEGWRRGGKRPLPPEDGAFSVAYDSDDGIAVTVYVYTRGHRDIPAGVKSDLIRKEFAGAKESIHEAKRLGFYKSVVEKSSGEARLGGDPKAPLALHASYLVETARGEAKSDLYVMVFRGRFIKFRCTRPAGDNAAREKSLARLLSKFGAALSE